MYLDSVSRRQTHSEKTEEESDFIFLSLGYFSYFFELQFKLEDNLK